MAVGNYGAIYNELQLDSVSGTKKPPEFGG
jgi:hypothetical protein